MKSGTKLHLPTLLLVVFIDFVGIGALIPILPYTIIDELGYSESVMTALLACFSLAMFVGNPVLGRLSDKMGRKPVLMISLGIGTVAHLVFAFSEHIAILFLSRIIAGLAAGNLGVVQALPLHQAPFAIAGIFTLIAFLLCLRLPMMAPLGSAKDSAAPRLSAFARIAILAKGPMGLFALSFFLLNLSFSQVEAAFVLLLKDVFFYAARDTGWIFTYVGVCIIIVEGGLIGAAVKRFGEVGTIIGGSLFSTILPLATVLICTTMVCIGFAFTNPSLSSAASKAARADEMGGALGLVQGFGSLGQVIGLAAAGPLYAAGGGQLSFGAGGAISIGLLLVILYIAKSQTLKTA